MSDTIGEARVIIGETLRSGAVPITWADQTEIILRDTAPSHVDPLAYVREAAADTLTDWVGPLAQPPVLRLLAVDHRGVRTFAVTYRMVDALQNYRQRYAAGAPA